MAKAEDPGARIREQVAGAQKIVKGLRWLEAGAVITLVGLIAQGIVDRVTRADDLAAARHTYEAYRELEVARIADSNASVKRLTADVQRLRDAGDAEAAQRVLEEAELRQEVGTKGLAWLERSHALFREAGPVRVLSPVGWAYLVLPGLIIMADLLRRLTRIVAGLAEELEGVV